MPKKKHVHFVTDEKHKGLLAKLGSKYGSMTKTFEFAIENLEKSETIGSCENCEIKNDFELSQKFRNLMNTVSFTAENIHELVKYLRGEFTARELLIRSREKAYEFGKQYNSFIRNPLENTYDNLLTIVKEYKKVTRFFKSVQVDHLNKKIIARVNVLEDLPIFVLTGFMGYLESLDFTFNIELYQQDVILQWLPPETYQQEKEKIEAKILSYIRKAEQVMKPYLMKKGHLLLSPQFLDWMSENIFDYQILPMSVAYHFASETIGELEDPSDVYKLASLIEDALYNINFAEEILFDFDDNKKILKFRIFFSSASLSKITLQGAILILGKFGWKLKQHKLDGSRLDMNFYYVGEDDPSILDSLYLINFSGYINQRFQKLTMVPLDELDELKKSLYEVDLSKFQDVFKKQGKKYANAIRLIAKNNLKKMRKIAFQVLPQALREGHHDPKDIDLIPEIGKTKAIFKRSDPVEMEQFRYIFSGMAEEFGYSDIQSRIYENMVIIEFNRPDELKLDKTKPEEPELAKIESEKKRIVQDSIE